MNITKGRSIAAILFLTAPALLAQTLYVPSGANGIGSSTNGNVGIGTSSPTTKAYVYGTLTVDPSSLPVNSYTEGIRIGSASNGYSIVTFGANPAASSGAQSNQWWVGRNGADNGFEIWGNSPGDVFHILPSGSVGIGTPNPFSALTITRDVLVPGSAQLELSPVGGNSSSTSYPAKLRFRSTFDAYPTDQLPRVTAQLFAGYSGGPWGSEYLAIQVGGSDDSGKDPVEKLRILASGNVGIGTTSPTSKLEVDNGAGSANINGLYIRASSNGGYTVLKAYSNWLDGNGGDLFSIANASGQGLIINSSRNVGIRTTNPTYPLTVNGTVRAKEVIVDTGWSDYVFDKDYKLPALSETEAAIKSDKHLPGIPSAKDVAEHGISVGEMQAKLLAKIEELTLHQIEQGKQISAVSAENAVLRHELESLKQSTSK